MKKFILLLVISITVIGCTTSQASKAPVDPAIQGQPTAVIIKESTSTPIPLATATPKPPTATPTPQYDLELLALDDETNYGYITVEGQVKNISARNLDSIVGVIQWYAADDTFIGSNNAYIEFTPLLPGQSSPFKGMAKVNPKATKYTVTFKKLLGGTIDTKDSRKK